MHSQYGVPEIQQFMADGGCAPVFSISTADMHTSSQQPQKQHHHAHHLHQQQQQQEAQRQHHHHHQHLHLHHHHFPQVQLQQPVPLPPPQAFHHFQPLPVTQQLFQDGHQFHLFQQEQQRRIHQQLVQLGLEIESGPENSTSPTRIIASAAAGGGGIPPFLGGGANFRLVANQSGGGGGGSRDRLNDEEAVILQGDEGSETHIHPWGTREDDSSIKESFWRPLDVDYINRNNKRCKEKQLEPSNSGKHCKSSKQADNTDDGSNSAAGNYKLFSELEAIYKPVNGGGGGGGANNNQQTGSGSALTGENPPATADAPRADWEGHKKDAAADQGSDTSTGEEAAQVEKPNKSSGGRRKGKRKQKQLSSIAAFLENLVKRLMEHQEGLHKKFLEVIDRRDQESMNQEEMWRQKEAAKASREAMARAEEQALASTREAAIVSFLEKITGESLNLPTRDRFQSQLPEEYSQKEGIKHMENQSDLACAVVAAEDDGNTEVNPTANTDTAGIVNPSRWPKAEVQTLIRVRSSLESRFQEPGLKGPLWEEVSSSMAAMGYHRSAKRCKEKWENINKYFRKTKDSPKKRSQHSKTCPYFHQLDQLYSKSLNKGTLAAGAVSAAPSSTVTSSRWNSSELVDAVVIPSEQTAGNFRFPDVDTARLEFLNKDDDDNQEASGSATAEQRDEEGGEEEGDAEEEGESQEEAAGSGGHGDGTEHDRSPRDAAVFFRRLES